MRCVATALALTLAIAGCQTAANQSAPLPTVEQAKAAIAANKARIWKDPDSIRDASIGEPYSCFGTWGGAACACVEANARNSFGGYVGLRRSIAVIEGSRDVYLRATDLTDAGIGRCNNLRPFPELSAPTAALNASSRR